MPRQPGGLSGEFDLVVGAEIENEGALCRAFSAVYNVAPASVKAVAVLAAEPVLPAVFCHGVAVTPAAAEPVGELIRGTAARYLPAVPVGFPSGS